MSSDPIERALRLAIKYGEARIDMSKLYVYATIPSPEYISVAKKAAKYLDEIASLVEELDNK